VKLADLVPDYCTPSEDLTGTAALRGTPGEEAGAIGCMPGDDETDHPFYDPPNPYIRIPFSRLQAMKADASLSDEELGRVEEAIEYQRVSHQGNVPRPTRNIRRS